MKRQTITIKDKAIAGILLLLLAVAAISGFIYYQKTFNDLFDSLIIPTTVIVCFALAGKIYNADVNTAVDDRISFSVMLLFGVLLLITLTVFLAILIINGMSDKIKSQCQLGFVLLFCVVVSTLVSGVIIVLIPHGLLKLSFTWEYFKKTINYLAGGFTIVSFIFLVTHEQGKSDDFLTYIGGAYCLFDVVMSILAYWGSKIKQHIKDKRQKQTYYCP